MRLKGKLLELSFYVVVFLTIVLILAEMDAFESFYAFTRFHEAWELDELVAAIPAFAIVAALYSLEQNRRLKKANTRLSEAEALIQELSMAKDEFLAAACHELKTPLNAVIASLNLAAFSDNPEEQRDCLDMAEKSTSEMKLLINDILDFSRIKYGRQEFTRKTFNVEDLLQTIRGIVQRQAELKGLKFRVETDPNMPPALVGQPGWIRLAVFNILGNALKYTDEGEVRLTTSFDPAPTGTLRFTVEDTGRGIEKNQLENIFIPYQRGNTLSPAKGTGLGLYIVKELMDLMHADINVRSVEGQGTVFTLLFSVELPAGEEA